MPPSDVWDWQMRANVIEAVRRAEELFRVRALDRMLGCGQNGCAVPLEDGRVLKITTESAEVEAAEALGALSLEDAAGFVRIDHQPVRERGERYHGLMTVWIYVREMLGRLSTAEERAVLRGVMGGYGSASGATAEEYIARAERLSLLPGFQALGRTLVALARRGTLLVDLDMNLGARRDGTIVAFDGAAISVIPARLPNPREPLVVVSPIEAESMERALPFSEARDAACRKKNQGSKWIRPSTRHAIYLRDEYTCSYCGFRDPYEIGGTWYVRGGSVQIEGQGYRRVGLTLDHILPCNRGGSNSPGNLVTTCITCNSAKKAMSPHQWLEYLRVRFATDKAFVEEIRRVVRNRIRRQLDRKGGGERAERALLLRHDARTKIDPRKWGFGRERGASEEE